MEPNPYEAPKSNQPLAHSQIVKRSLGLAALLLLTPPAMVIAAFVCRKADVMFPAHRFLTVFGIPLGVLVGLMALAALLWRPRKDSSKSTWRGIHFILATPIAVAIAIGVGLVLTGVTYMAASTPGGGMAPWGEWAMMATWWSPPSITLLVMLWLVWRNR
jgi:hypothetical protein